jgi:type VI secretion system protein VasG
MTSNLASAEIVHLCAGGRRPATEQLESVIRPTLSRHFKPALLGRMKVVPYYPVAGEVLDELVGLKLARFGERLARRRLGFSHCPALVGTLAERCAHSESGARLIDHLIEQTLQPQVVDRLLAAMASGETLQRVHATLDGDGAVVCEFA